MARDFQQYFVNLQKHNIQAYLPGGTNLPTGCSGFATFNREHRLCQACNAAYACMSRKLGIWLTNRTEHFVPTYLELKYRSNTVDVPPPLSCVINNSSPVVGYLGFDWLPNVTAHPCHRQGALFIKTLSDAGMNAHRILMIDDIDACDVVIVPMLVTKCDHRIMSRLMHYFSYNGLSHKPKIVCYHIDFRPKPVQPFGIRMFDMADAYFHTNFSTKWLDTDKPIITVPWGTYYAPNAARELACQNKISITAVAGTDPKKELHNNENYAGSRLDYILAVARAVYPLQVDLYGSGWEKIKFPKNLKKKGFNYKFDIYANYGAVVDIVEDLYVPTWNSSGYWSDRPVLAMESGTHTITTLPWLSSMFASCIHMSDLLSYGKFEYDYSAIKADWEKLQFKHFALYRMQTMLEVLFDNKSIVPVGPIDINRKWSPDFTNHDNRGY